MRKYPENRDPQKRLLSRRAYYQRNKERINRQLKEKRAGWWAGVMSRIDEIVSKNKH